MTWASSGNVFGPINGCHRSSSCPRSKFIKRPIRWLRAITRFRGTMSGGPDFAYRLAVDRTTPEQRAELDLRSWELAYNGAEPVRAATIDLFAKTFDGVRLPPGRDVSLLRVAESTLYVAGPTKLEGARVGRFVATKLRAAASWVRPTTPPACAS